MFSYSTRIYRAYILLGIKKKLNKNCPFPTV